MKHPELVKFRKSKKLNQKEFADSLNVQQALIAMIENGSRKPSRSFEEKLFSVYGFTLDKEPEPIEIKIPDNIAAIPIYDIGAAAGVGTILMDEPDKDKMYFDKRFLKQILKTDNYSGLQIIHAQGDSMDSGWNQPDDIKDGDLLMVDTTQTSGNNQIFVILVNNSELRVKRLYKRGETLFISSNNPKYKEEIYTPDNSDFEVKVIGKVIWNGTKESV